ncbi:MAG: DUF3224 domain-containing protein [Chloroflexi bacterium]|nr:DUF3224 domain-containing protein [Chloroflexota bacterium]
MTIRRGSFLLLALILLAPAAWRAPGAQALVSITTTGSITVTGVTIAATQQTGAATVRYVDIYETFAGTMTGAGVAMLRTVTYPNGTETYSGLNEFSGSVRGVAGTGELIFRDMGSAVNGNAFGRLWVMDTRGALLNLRGQGTYQGTLGVGLGYALQLYY